MVQERQLVQKIARALAPHRATSSRRKMSSRLKMGIGDDPAVISPAGRTDWVLSCDTFLEDVHFRLNTHPPDSVGYKALARATSDLAAMGATPRYFLLTIALPATRTGQWLDAFLKGMGRAARELGITVIGGDTTKSRTVFISITVLGEIPPDRALTRSGARPGDIIYVSGKLGRAQLGLELVLRGPAPNRKLPPPPAPPLPRQPSRRKNLRQQSSPGSDPRSRRRQAPQPQPRSPAASPARRRRLRTPLHNPSAPSKKTPPRPGRRNFNRDRRNHAQSPNPTGCARRKNKAAGVPRLGSVSVTSIT